MEQKVQGRVDPRDEEEEKVPHMEPPGSLPELMVQPFHELCLTIF